MAAMRLPWHRSRDLPDGWEETVARDVAVWARLDDTERVVLAEHARWLLHHIRWEAARDFALTDEVRAVIAAQAALLVLGLDIEAAYGAVSSVLVHPSTVVLRGQRAAPGGHGLATDAPELIHGQTAWRGTVTIAWHAARRAARAPEHGVDVVLHEFAHVLDGIDGTIDGTPPIEDASARRRWVQVCTREYDALQRGVSDGLLRPYAATNVGEFFAVATEAFFTRPVRMAEARPDLYEVLQNFYHQDPAARAARQAGAAAAPHDD